MRAPSLLLLLLLLLQLALLQAGTASSWSRLLPRWLPRSLQPQSQSLAQAQSLTQSLTQSPSQSLTQSQSQSRGQAEAQAQVLFVVGGPGSGKGTLCSQLAASQSQGQGQGQGQSYSHISAGSLLRRELSRWSTDSSGGGGSSSGGSGSGSGSGGGVMAMAPHSEAVLSEREAEEVRRVVDSGGLVDSAVMVRLLKRELQSRRSKVLTEHGVDVSPSTCSDECGGHLYLLDGFPRNWENHLQWQKEMASQLKEGSEEGVEVEVVGCLLLECSPEVMIQRCLARGVTGDATGNMEVRSDDRLDVIRQRLDTFRRNMDRVTEYYGSPQVNKLLRVNADLPKEEVFAIVQKRLKEIRRKRSATTL